MGFGVARDGQGLEVGNADADAIAALDNLRDEWLGFGNRLGEFVATAEKEERAPLLPLVRLRELFRVGGAATRRESIVVLKFGTHRAGLVVDTLLGEFQTVIKPLSPMFSEVKCISGSTILGSGEVALILDVAALMHAVGGKGAAQLAA